MENPSSKSPLSQAPQIPPVTASGATTTTPTFPATESAINITATEIPLHTAVQFKQNWLLQYSGILLMLSQALLFIELFALVLLGVLAIVTIVSLVKQTRYVKRVMNAHSFATRIKVLVLGAFLLPALAAVVGDASGAAQYGGQIGETAWLAFVGLYTGFIAVTLMQISSMIYIQTNGQKTGLNTAGKVLYYLLWLPLLAISFFVLTLANSLHDPSTD